LKTKIIALITLILLCSGLNAHARTRNVNIEKLKFEICLAYGICSFVFLDKEQSSKAGFFHDKVVIRMESLGNMTFVDQCGTGPSIKEYVWQEAMLEIAKAQEIRVFGHKFRHTLQGDLFLDNINIKDIVLEIIEELNRC